MRLSAMGRDDLRVGWYQTGSITSLPVDALLEDQCKWQEDMEEAVLLLYDPAFSAHGALAVKAYRVARPYGELHSKVNFSVEAVRASGVTATGILTEIPVTIHCSVMLQALLLDMEESTLRDERYYRVDMNGRSLLGKSIHALEANVESLEREQRDLFGYQRQMMRIQHFVQAMRAKNDALIASGAPPLPEEDMRPDNVPAPIQRQSAMYTMLQIDLHARQIGNYAAQALGKLYMVDRLQK